METPLQRKSKLWREETFVDDDTTSNKSWSEEKLLSSSPESASGIIEMKMSTDGLSPKQNSVEIPKSKNDNIAPAFRFLNRFEQIKFRICASLDCAFQGWLLPEERCVKCGCVTLYFGPEPNIWKGPLEILNAESYCKMYEKWKISYLKEIYQLRYNFLLNNDDGKLLFERNLNKKGKV